MAVTLPPFQVHLLLIPQFPDLSLSVCYVTTWNYKQWVVEYCNERWKGDCKYVNMLTTRKWSRQSSISYWKLNYLIVTMAYMDTLFVIKNWNYFVKVYNNWIILHWLLLHLACNDTLLFYAHRVNCLWRENTFMPFVETFSTYQVPLIKWKTSVQPILQRTHLLAIALSSDCEGEGLRTNITLLVLQFCAWCILFCQKTVVLFLKMNIF